MEIRDERLATGWTMRSISRGATDAASKTTSARARNHRALPERVTWFGWLFHSWAPRLAMIAVVVAAGIVLGYRTRR